MSKIPRILVGALAVGLAALSVTAVSAQQPKDSVDIDFTASTCLVEIDFNDTSGNFSDLIEWSTQKGIVVTERPDVILEDTLANESGVVASATLTPGTYTVRATLFDGEKNIDSETEQVVCPDPTPTPTATAVPPTATPVPPTATPAPTATPVVKEVEVIVQSDTFAFCSNGAVVNLTKGERCAVTPPPVVVQATPITVTQPSGSIRPPSTGDGGLVQNVLWTRMFTNDTGCDAGWCGGLDDYMSVWHYSPYEGLWFWDW